MRKTLFSSGDLGDVCLSLPTVKHLGGGDYFVGDRPWTNPIVSRLHLIADLLREQPYINSVNIHQGETITHDFSTFRNGGLPYGVTLAEIQARWLRVKADMDSPWLTVEPNDGMASRIIVARSPRYQNHYFPWNRLVETFREEMLFVGLPSEHSDFCEQFGDVAYLPTKNLLEVAQAIAGAELFIGNQSSPNAVCEGLKVRMVQEVCLAAPDCVFIRPTAIHCFDGGLKFEACGKSFSSDPIQIRPFIDLQTCPHGGWKISYDGESAKTYDFSAALEQLRCNLRMKQREVPKNLKDIIVQQLQDAAPPTPELRPIIACRELLAKLNTQSESTHSRSDPYQKAPVSGLH